MLVRDDEVEENDDDGVDEKDGREAGGGGVREGEVDAVGPVDALLVVVPIEPLVVVVL